MTSGACHIPLTRHRPYVLFCLTRVCAVVATQMQSVAVGWQIYSLTQNPLDLGLVALAQFLPALALMLLAGHAADRYPRRTVLRLSLAVQGIAICALAIGTASGWLTRELIFAIVALLGAAKAFESPALSSLLPTIVPPPLFPRAVAGSASANQLATIAGPALGGFLFVVSPSGTYALCVILLLVAGLCLTLIPPPAPLARGQKFSLGGLFAGFTYIRQQPIVLGAISLDLFAVLLGGTLGLLPVFARDILSVGAWGLGLLRACPAAGALSMSLVLAVWPLRRNVGRTMYASVAIYGLATIVFALSTSLPVSMAALVVLGSADVVSVVIRSTLVQLATPDIMRGRVSAVNSLFIGTSNQLGDFRSGGMAAWLGTVPAVLIGGVGTLAVVLASVRLFPRLFGVDAMDAASVQPLPDAGKPARPVLSAS